MTKSQTAYSVSERSIMLKYIFLLVLLTIWSTGVEGSGRCDISDRVKLALRTMNSATVPKVVDCVVNQGQCDSTGTWVRSHAR